MLASISVWLVHAVLTRAALSQHRLELTWGTGAPDGHEREMIFINGEYPGPLLDIQQGDWVEVEVYNLLPFNTTIHFHGMFKHYLCSHVAHTVQGYTRRIHRGRTASRALLSSPSTRTPHISTVGSPIRTAATSTTPIHGDRSTMGHMAQ